LPASYAELRQCFQQRTPRLVDVQDYAIHGWQSIFHVINWLFVAAPLGVVPPEAATAELASLPAVSRRRVATRMAELRRSSDLA
jgi:tryptophan halogenase